MKKSIFASLFIVAFAVSATAAYAEAEPYHVGCIFAVTGSASWLGEPEQIGRASCRERVCLYV